MSLLFHGPRGAIEQRWIFYALLRDNVQHHLEGGRIGDSFSALHQMALALGGKPTSVSAAELRRELERVEKELVSRPISQLAISNRTRAVISLAFPIPDLESTTLVSDWGGTVEAAAGAKTLGDIFGYFVTALLRITDQPGPAALVTVTDL
jgi:hypothetical protein